MGCLRNVLKSILMITLQFFGWINELNPTFIQMNITMTINYNWNASPRVQLSNSQILNFWFLYIFFGVFLFYVFCLLDLVFYFSFFVVQNRLKEESTIFVLLLLMKNILSFSFGALVCDYIYFITHNILLCASEDKET